MKPRTVAIAVVFVAFTAWSFAVPIVDHGFPGLFSLVLRESWAMQMILDLAIAMTAISAWAIPDARARGINPWPFVAGFYTFGSIAVLGYLLVRGWKRECSPTLAPCQRASA